MQRQVAFQFIRSNGQISESRMPFANGDHGGNYDALKRVWREHFGDAVDFEHVNVWHDNKYTDMFVDEMGRMKGLPLNFHATGIYRANALAHETPPPPPSTLPAIYGDVLLFREKIWG